MRTKKDNLTDVMDIVSQPESTESTPPQIKPPKGLNDYQVYTPDGEIIDLTLTVLPPTVQKNKKGHTTKKIMAAVDKKGNQYILIIDSVE
ncbi:MAG TPA: hypothetical protein PLS49_02105 [Candidatus Woesebacteria bacterium]|nr:hypothetical protein [Candidatus Woesebacteria bacterium]